MNNKTSRKRVLSIALRVVLLLIPVLIGNAAACFAEEDEERYINVGYSCDDLYSEFIYSHDMMLSDATVLSTDLAKVSVGLACAAYKETEIKSCLVDQMKYTLVGNDTCNYSRSATYTDNDYVAYCIAYRKIGNYNVYIIPIRGTTGNCEWFSNFNLGTTDYHEGFKKAADEVLYTIYNGITTSNNIILLTGHSRGAAVARIDT